MDSHQLDILSRLDTELPLIDSEVLRDSVCWSRPRRLPDWNRVTASGSPHGALAVQLPDMGG